MDSMLQRLVATWIKSQDQSPRRVPTATVRCESLEGRQLLSTMSLYRSNAVLPSAPNTQHFQLSSRGTLNGQNAGGSLNSGGSVNGSPIRQWLSVGGQAQEQGQGQGLRPFGGLRNQGQVFGGGAGRRGLGLRNVQAGKLAVAGTSLTTLEAPGSHNSVPVPVQAAPAGQAQAQTQAQPADVSLTHSEIPATTLTQADGGGSTQTPGDWAAWSGAAQEPLSVPTRPVGMGVPRSVAPTATLTTTTSGPSDELKTAFDKLRTDTEAIHDKSEVTPKLMAAVRHDLEAIQKASTSEPDQAALDALAADLKAIDGQLPTEAQQAQIVTHFTAVLQSQGITDQTLIDTAVADIQAVVAATHITADDLATIAADHEAIKAAMSGGAEAPPQLTPSTNDLVGGLLSGLTGGLDTGGPTVGSWSLGGAPGGLISGFPMTFDLAAGHAQGGPIHVSSVSAAGQVNAMPGGSVGHGQFTPVQIAGQSEAVNVQSRPVTGNVGFAGGVMMGQSGPGMSFNGRGMGGRFTGPGPWGV